MSFEGIKYRAAQYRREMMRHPATPEMASTEARTGFWRFAPVVVLIAALAVLYLAGGAHYFSLAYLAERHEALRGVVDAHPLSAPLVFGVAYAVSVAISLPAASILTIVGGFLFGWLVAGLVVAVAATIGATALFLAARSAFGQGLRQRIGPRAAKLAEGFEEDAFGYLLVLRLAPVFPFFLVNVAPAFFKVPLGVYVTATFFGILPGTFAYAYLGTGLESALDAAAAAGRDVSVADLVTWQLSLAFLLLAVVAAVPLVIRRLRGRRRG